MMKSDSRASTAEQLPAPQIILLHLLPGVLVVIFDLIVAPIVQGIGLPPHFTVILGNAVIIVSFELWYLLKQGKQLSGRPSLKASTLYREPMPWWQCVVLVLLLLVWAAAVFMLLGPIGARLRESVFAWMPAVFRAAGDLPDVTLYSSGALAVTAVFLFVFTGIVVPVVEELYYRGHLMARMSRLGWWAPVVSLVLWALNHFWQPWDVILFVVASLPLMLVVQWKKNAYISVAAHTIVNVLNALMMAGALLGLAP